MASTRQKLQHVYQEGYLGKVKLHNRIIMSAVNVEAQPDFIDGELNPRLLDYYEERASGGVALIIASAGYVEKQARRGSSYLGIWDDSFVTSLSKLVQRVHKHGAKIGLHIAHAGSYGPSALNGRQAVSASSFTNWLIKEECKELSIEEIKGIVASFARAVKRAKEAGFDLVEYNAYSGYLIREFLCPRSNKRNDEYGGALENRLRFFKEIIYASRQEVGEDYTLIARISGDEYLPGGNSLEEAKEIAKSLQEYGIDGLHVSPAGHEASLPLTQGMSPKGAFVYLAQGVKKEVEIPVITAHIGDIFLAEKVLAEGKADFVAFGRRLLVDPEFPRKAQQGRFEDIRPCVRCHQGCYDRIWVGEEATCLMNPAVLREREFEIQTASPKKRVMIVGGGPGGMEAASVAALKGHEVVLYDSNPHLGGQLVPCSAPPGKEDFAEAIRYWTTLLVKLNVRVVLSTEVTPETVDMEKPQVVIVATGAKPLIPAIPGADKTNVVTFFDVLAGGAEVGKRVVVIGGGGIGCETAYYLAEKGAMKPEVATFLIEWGVLDPRTNLNRLENGREITILEMLPATARDVGITRRGFLRRLLTMYGVNVVTEAKATAITSSGVEFDKAGMVQVIPADTVVLAAGTQSENALYYQLQGKVPELHILGDAKEPGKAIDAIREAAVTARQI